MRDKMKKALSEAISEAMETMFFLCPEPVGSSGPRKGRKAPTSELIVQVQTAGANPYRFSLNLSEALVEKMAANILERQPRSFDRDELEDVACELANIVAGGFLNRLDIVGTKTLMVPHVVKGVGERSGPCVEYVAEVEGEPFVVHLYHNDTVDEEAA